MNRRPFKFLIKHISDFPLPELNRKAIVQGHCHHKAVMGFKEEMTVLQVNVCTGYWIFAFRVKHVSQNVPVT